MNVVIFGAGNIGRGFLAPLFKNASITFIDINKNLIDVINKQREYPIFVVSETGKDVAMVKNVSALHVGDIAHIAQRVLAADFILTAVSGQFLPSVAKVLTEVFLRINKKRFKWKLNVVVIACENLKDNTECLKQSLMNELNDRVPRNFFSDFSFPNCVVDRIVPNSAEFHLDDPLAVVVESYFQFVVDQNALQNPILIDGIQSTDNIPAVLEQKLFTLNATHAVVSYLGKIAGFEFIHEAIADHHIFELARGVQREMSELLLVDYPTLKAGTQFSFASCILERFRNPHLKDRLERVGRDPVRKLGASERLINPAQRLLNIGQIPTYISSGIVSALFYNVGADVQSQQLQIELKNRPVEVVLSEISSLNIGSKLSEMICSQYHLRSL